VTSEPPIAIAGQSPGWIRSRGNVLRGSRDGCSSWSVDRVLGGLIELFAATGRPRSRLPSGAIGGDVGAYREPAPIDNLIEYSGTPARQVLHALSVRWGPVRVLKSPHESTGASIGTALTPAMWLVHRRAVSLRSVSRSPTDGRRFPHRGRPRRGPTRRSLADRWDRVASPSGFAAIPLDVSPAA
jgi:hypothetical protein